MDQINLHRQKLYSLIVAGLSFISLLLPWMSLGMFGSVNGMRQWGLLSLLGVIGVAAACFMGDRAAQFDDMTKKVALGSFAAIALGALIFYFNMNSGLFTPSTGFGLWLCLITGIAGFLWVLGIIKLPDNKKP